MKKVAVFGNTGGGKSTLSRKLVAITDLPLYILDKIQYQAGGVEVAERDFKQAHQQILESASWIVDGYGCPETLWLRLDAADTLVYIDLPLARHFLWVTKRSIAGLFVNPEGWPENTPILKSSISSYRVLFACHKYLTPRYREYVRQQREVKRVYHLKSIAEIQGFLKEIASQQSN